jgi:diketogulonate reductase-like aldo/keto reductase
MSALKASIKVDGFEVPRLAFGYGSLMKWSADHKPLVTDSEKEVSFALEAGYRHLDGGELYKNSESVGVCISKALKTMKREDLFVSLKINTYANIGFSGPDHIHNAALKQIEVLNLQGYIDCVQLHFPPRGKKGNLTNREAWRCLEDLKDKKIARIIGVSNWELHDYDDIMNASDLKYKPMINETELNPHVYNSPISKALREYEAKNGITSMVFGCLSSLTGRAPNDQTVHLREKLSHLSKSTGYTESQLLLRWAWQRTSGVLLTSSSRKERMEEVVQVLSNESPLEEEVLLEIEQAALQDGHEDRKVYKHPHMEKA